MREWELVLLRKYSGRDVNLIPNFTLIFETDSWYTDLNSVLGMLAAAQCLR